LGALLFMSTQAAARESCVATVSLADDIESSPFWLLRTVTIWATRHGALMATYRAHILGVSRKFVRQVDQLVVDDLDLL